MKFAQALDISHFKHWKETIQMQWTISTHKCKLHVTQSHNLVESNDQVS